MLNAKVSRTVVEKTAAQTAGVGGESLVGVRVWWWSEGDGRPKMERAGLFWW